ncbi:MAG TPA: hypothetical protein VFF11_06010, partial [Candidatus Binatia bacterium]|nr:hypothetical protein [Candidatus Binatia bacterium]
MKNIFGISLALGLTAFSLSAQNAAQFGNLPLWFEAGSPAKFIAHGAKSEFTVTPSGAEFTLAKAGFESVNGGLQLVGANPAARISGADELTGKINYFVGNNPQKWRANVPTFSKVRVEEVYPGINLVYYGNQQKLEYDFDLSAGANPSDIALRFDGAKSVSLNPQGGLVVQFKNGNVIQHPPLAYQTIHGKRQTIVAKYMMVDSHTATFELADYNHSQTLVIDPVLTYSTYYGGNYGEDAWAI